LYKTDARENGYLVSSGENTKGRNGTVWKPTIGMFPKEVVC
jgi:hypothetical protein